MWEGEGVVEMGAGEVGGSRDGNKGNDRDGS